MRTIGRHRLATSPRGDTVRLCGYCGVAWHRSQLRRDASGLLACPDDQSGLDSLTLSEGNAAGASHRQLGLRTDHSDGGIDSPNTVPDPGFVDPNGIPPNPVNQGPTGPLSVIVELWLRGDSAEASGSVVTRWTDLSNRSNHCYPVAAASAPTLAVDTDGLPVVIFSGSQWLNSTNFHSARPSWIWAVISPTILSAGPTYMVRGTIGLVLDFASAVRGAGATLGFALATTTAWQRVRLAGAEFGSPLDIQVKAVTGSSGPNGSFGVTKTTIGAASVAGATPAAFRMKELVMAAGIPTAAESNAIDAYGIARYGEDYFA